LQKKGRGKDKVEVNVGVWMRFSPRFFVLHVFVYMYFKLRVQSIKNTKVHFFL
jgi:hypothetical protein